MVRAVVEKTASLTHAAAVTPTHYSLAALQVVPPRHRDADKGTPGTKEAEDRGEGVGEARALAEGLGRSDAVAQAVALALGTRQRPAVNSAPGLQAAREEL